MRRRRSRRFRRSGREAGVAVEMKVPSGKEPWQWLVRVFTTKGWKTFDPAGREERAGDYARRAARTRGRSRCRAFRDLARKGESTRAKVANASNFMSANSSTAESRASADRGPWWWVPFAVLCRRGAVRRRDDRSGHHVQAARRAATRRSRCTRAGSTCRMRSSRCGARWCSGSARGAAGWS